jgi:hypothetical protein
MEMARVRTSTTTRVGDERYIVQHIDSERAEAIARGNGWDGGEGLLDYCDAGAAAATYTEHATLAEAIATAQAELAKGRLLFVQVPFVYRANFHFRQPRLTATSGQFSDGAA